MPLICFSYIASIHSSTITKSYSRRQNIQILTTIVNHHLRGIAALNNTPNNLIRKTISHLLGNKSVQWPSTVPRIVAFIAQPGFHIIANVEDNSAVIESSLEFFKPDVDDVP